MIKKFKRPSNKPDTVLLPIVPDLHILKEIRDSGKERNPLEKAVKDWPKYDPQKLFAIKDKMKARFEKMLSLTYAKLTQNGLETEFPLTAQWIKKHYRTTWWTKLTGWIGGNLLRILFRWNKSKLASRITQTSIEWVLKDLEEKNLLKHTS